MPAATRATTRKLDVTCPFCMDADATITLDLSELPRCTCTGCDATFTPADAAMLLEALSRKWAAVDAWIGKAPVRDS